MDDSAGRADQGDTKSKGELMGEREVSASAIVAVSCDDGRDRNDGTVADEEAEEESGGEDCDTDEDESGGED